jgi:predicted transcriptional regulator
LSRYNFIHIADFDPTRDFMKAITKDLLTAGNIAKQLKISDAVVKKAIQKLGVKPAAKKGVCNYYSKDIIPKIKSAVN